MNIYAMLGQTKYSFQTFIVLECPISGPNLTIVWLCAFSPAIQNFRHTPLIGHQQHGALGLGRFAARQVGRLEYQTRRGPRLRPLGTVVKWSMVICLVFFGWSKFRDSPPTYETCPLRPWLWYLNGFDDDFLVGESINLLVCYCLIFVWRYPFEVTKSKTGLWF